MDECTIWELNNIVENLTYTNREQKEQLRLIAYLLAKANFKGIKKKDDVGKLPWDGDADGEYVERMSLDEMGKIFKFF